MSKRRWRHDGPMMSAQGFGHSWQMLQTILRMSEAHGKARKETATLWHFYRAHPEAIPTQRDLEHVPPETFIAHAHELMQRFKAERERRKEVFEAEMGRRWIAFHRERIATKGRGNE